MRTLNRAHHGIRDTGEFGGPTTTDILKNLPYTPSHIFLRLLQHPNCTLPHPSSTYPFTEKVRLFEVHAEVLVRAVERLALTEMAPEVPFPEVHVEGLVVKVPVLAELAQGVS